MKLRWYLGKGGGLGEVSKKVEIAESGRCATSFIRLCPFRGGGEIGEEKLKSVIAMINYDGI